MLFAVMAVRSVGVHLSESVSSSAVDIRNARNENNRKYICKSELVMNVKIATET